MKSSLCAYSHGYRLVKRTITVVGQGADVATAAYKNDKQVIFKKCAPLNDRISERNNTQVDNDKDPKASMPMYNLIEYSNNYSNTSESLWQYYREELYDNITYSNPFKFKSRVLNNTDNTGTVNVEMTAPVKYLSNFWVTLEMPVMNCEINLIIAWSANCVICGVDRATTVAGTVRKLYVSFVTLLTQDNTKLPQQLKPGFKRRINYNKYQSKVSTQAQNQYLNYLTDPNFQGMYRIFVLLFENYAVRKEYFLSKVKIKYYNIMIDTCISMYIFHLPSILKALMIKDSYVCDVKYITIYTN